MFVFIVRSSLSSDVLQATTLYSLDPQADENGETQTALKWKRRSVSDDKGIQRSFYYAELHDIKLMKSELRASRPFYSAKVCQLHFQLNIRVQFTLLFFYQCIEMPCIRRKSLISKRILHLFLDLLGFVHMLNTFLNMLLKL